MAGGGAVKATKDIDFSKVFAQFDTDNSGNLDKKELLRAIRSIGLPAEVLDTYWVQLDVDGNNVGAAGSCRREQCRPTGCSWIMSTGTM